MVNFQRVNSLLFSLQCIAVATGERRKFWIREEASVSLILLHHVQGKVHKMCVGWI